MQDIVVHFSKVLWSALAAHLFSRYPSSEWATWLEYGWRTSPDSLVLAARYCDLPQSGELDDTVPHVAFQEPYSLRIALQAEQHPFAVGVAHSHPAECLPIASSIDDDMDSYYSQYLSGFTGNRPYPSLIFSKINGDVIGSGRVWWGGRWQPVTRMVVEGRAVATWVAGNPPKEKQILEKRVTRLSSAMGRRAAQRLRDARIGVVGAGGTGAPAIEILARAGVGHITVIDPDAVEHSNLERVHGAYESDVVHHRSKVEVARNHVRGIDPEISFTGLVGRIPQPQVIDELAKCDVILGCTDQQHSRLALNEMGLRYCVPVIDMGVTLEGANGKVSAQILQLLLLNAGGACVVCRGMVDWKRIGQELMSPDEQQQRREAAVEAQQRGEDPHGYWRDVPQLNTVGYLTSAAASLGAGCAIGLATDAFSLGFERAQWTYFATPIEALAWHEPRKPDCFCGRIEGIGAQRPEEHMVNCPLHWEAVRVV
jgi:molybdopterin/thiamine biosynthesis adenylyltransferase